MSKIPQRSASGIPKPPQSRPNAQSTLINPPGVATKAPSKTTEKPKRLAKKRDEKVEREFELPPLSIVGKKKEIDFEEIRKKVIRRGNPEGEDKKQLAQILKHLRDTNAKILVHEYVNLVAKYTSDNGECMRKVMEEDLASFRKMVTKVYENMTQDVSDVLVNEQIQTANFYEERFDMYNNKMLQMISEIFQMIPEFNFQRYSQEKEDYLKYICPLPQLTEVDAEDADLQKRQEAFHRLQWLKIEEGRLADENKRLQMRLEELKAEHRREQNQGAMKNQIMEDKMHVLEEEEHEKEAHLKDLENTLGKNIVRTEAFIRLEEDEAIRLTKPQKPEGRKMVHKMQHKKSEWLSNTAAGLEQEALDKSSKAAYNRAEEIKRHRRRQREEGKDTSLFGHSSGYEVDYEDMASTAQKMQEKTARQIRTTVTEKREGSPKRRGCQGPCR